MDITDVKHVPKKEMPNLIIELEAKMQAAAEALDFERAITLRQQQIGWHRGMGHSKRALKFIGKVFVLTALLGFLSIFNSIFLNFYIISSFSLGYVAHLLADATTTAGLPD